MGDRERAAVTEPQPTMARSAVGEVLLARKGPPIPGRGGPKPLKPAVPPGPKTTPMFRAFKGSIEPAMFNRPEAMSEQQLADLCDQFNFVAKEAELFKTQILGDLMLDKGNTGDYDVTKLAADTKRFWARIFELRRAEEDELYKKSLEEALKKGEKEPPKPEPEPDPEIWSADRIREHNKGFRPGTGVDSIKEHRPSSISTARVNLDKPKEAFVEVKSLAKANAQLKDAGSFIQFEMVGKPDKDGFVKIRPVWSMERPVTTTDEESHSKLVEFNRERQQKIGTGQQADAGKEYVSWADCHRTAQTIMGSEEKNSGIGDTERVVMKGTKDLVAPIPKDKIQAIPNATDHGANRAMHGFYAAAMPNLKKKLETKAKSGPLTEPEAKLLEMIKAEGEGSDPPKNFRKAYRAVCDDPKLAKEFAQDFGINEAIVPRVGTAFSQINDEVEKKNILDAGGDAWNFHFAGVVLVNDDGSYMTLENLSVEDPGSVNDSWYFAVYDPKQGKSFHEVNKKDSHVGEHPITLLFDKTPK